MESTPAGRAPSLLERGRLLTDAKRVAEAMELFRAAAAQDPNDAEAWCLLAHGALRLGDHRASLGHAETALRCAPGSDWAHRLRAISLLFLKRLPDAYEAATAAVRCAPNEPATLTVLGSVAFERRRLEEAAILGRRLLHMAPESAAGPALMAQVAELRRARGQALALYEHALRLEPTKASALEGMARLQAQGARNDERAEILGLVLRERPTEGDRQEQLTSALADLAFEGSLGSRHRSIGAVLAGVFWLYAALGFALFFGWDEAGQAFGGSLLLAYGIGLPLVLAAFYPLLRRRFVGRLSGGLAGMFEPLMGKHLRDRGKLLAVVIGAFALVVGFVPALRSDPLSALGLVLSLVAMVVWLTLAAFSVYLAWLWLRDAVVLAWHAVIGGERAAAHKEVLGLVVALAVGTAAVLLLLALGSDLAYGASLIWLFAGPMLSARLIQRTRLVASLALVVGGSAASLAVYLLPDGPARGVFASTVGVASLLGWLMLPSAVIGRLRVAQERRRMALLIGPEPEIPAAAS